MSLTAERLRQVLSYDEMTGVFTWRITLSNRAKAGSAAGVSERYVRITIDGKPYYAHRLAWLYVHGEWPASLLDHRDRSREHNAMRNLRPATKQQNAANAKLPSHNTSGRVGVYWYRSRAKWRAAITVAGKLKTVGYFRSFDDAVAARADAEQRHFGEFAAHVV